MAQLLMEVKELLLDGGQIGGNRIGTLSKVGSTPSCIVKTCQHRQEGVPVDVTRNDVILDVQKTLRP